MKRKKQEVPISIQEAIEDLKEEIQGIKEKGVVVREITKEVSKVTEVEPVKEITKEVIKTDEETTALLKAQIAGLEYRTVKLESRATQALYYPTIPVTFPALPYGNVSSGNVALSAQNYLDLSARELRITGDATVSGTLSAAGLSYFSSPLTITSTTTPQFSLRYDATNKLDTSVSSAGEVTFAASGSLVETFPVTGTYNLKRGTEAILAVDANGAIVIDCQRNRPGNHPSAFWNWSNQLLHHLLLYEFRR